MSRYVEVSFYFENEQLVECFPMSAPPSVGDTIEIDQPYIVKKLTYSLVQSLVNDFIQDGRDSFPYCVDIELERKY